ncbi:MAG: signal peptidase I [archaeon]
MFGKNKGLNKTGLKKAKPTKEWKPKSLFGKAWYFIWYDDSPLSWIANVVLAYVLIKFIVYPGLGLLLGTNYPIVAVVSNSMEHSSDFDTWWQNNEDYYLALNITKEGFEGYPYHNGFNRGDIMFLMGKAPKDIEVGDILVFQSKKPYPIIHRVIDKQEKGMWVFQTKGDNNRGQIRDFELDETRVLESQAIGRAAIRLPWLGFVKIWFVDLLKLAGIGS